MLLSFGRAMIFPRIRPLSSLFMVLSLVLGLGHAVAFGESLDQDRIRADYENGDFDPVISRIEAFERRNSAYSFEDSVFIAKYLAVIYTADPQTREKGKFYMFRLLELLPSAKIVDMFVSDEIDRIFEKVKEEYQYRLRNLGKAPRRREAPTDTLAAAGRDPKPRPAPEARERKSWAKLYWVAGGIGLAGVGTALYLQSRTESSPDRVYVVAK